MSTESAYVVKTQKNETVDLWHVRLGHVSYHKLKLMMTKSMLKGLPQLKILEDTVCAVHQYSKTHQLPFEKSRYGAKMPLEMVHSDVFTSVKHSSIRGMCYMVTFIDDFSMYVRVYFMKENSRIFEKIKDFKENVEREMRGKI